MGVLSGWRFALACAVDATRDVKNEKPGVMQKGNH